MCRERKNECTYVFLFNLIHLAITFVFGNKTLESHSSLRCIIYLRTRLGELSPELRPIIYYYDRLITKLYIESQNIYYMFLIYIYIYIHTTYVNMFVSAK